MLVYHTFLADVTTSANKKLPKLSDSQLNIQASKARKPTRKHLEDCVSCRVQYVVLGPRPMTPENFSQSRLEKP